MNTYIADAESSLRLGVFISFFIILAMLELFFPRRNLHYSKLQRWASNIGLSVFNTIFLRIVLPFAGVGVAVLARENGWGVLNKIELPGWLGTIIFLIIFDLTIYWQHRIYHLVPVLWRFHRMHHTDMDYDLTTGNRFHPLSILLSSVIKVMLILVMGPSAFAVVLAEIILNATSMFNHSNIKLSDLLDRRLRKILVTPDMHRIHHSVERSEHNKNFGFNLSCWDRIFFSYLENPRQAQSEMDIGLKGFQDKKSLNLFSLLLQPFRSGSEPEP
jgi:sterol desaturase/sphingolipid hydroxylase (fatty acid hydroxylase superfamily)